MAAASLRYDDGKRLNGIGTLASKSRLTGAEGDPSCKPFEVLLMANNSNGRQEGISCSYDVMMVMIDDGGQDCSNGQVSK